MRCVLTIYTVHNRNCLILFDIPAIENDHTSIYLFPGPKHGHESKCYTVVERYMAYNWGERSEPPPSVADEGLVYIYRPVRTYVHS